MLSATASGVRLLITKGIGLGAGALRKARAVSYSQLLPGNTGMITRGRAIVGAVEHVDVLGGEVASSRRG